MVGEIGVRIQRLVGGGPVRRAQFQRYERS